MTVLTDMTIVAARGHAGRYTRRECWESLRRPDVSIQIFMHGCSMLVRRDIQCCAPLLSSRTYSLFDRRWRSSRVMMPAKRPSEGNMSPPGRREPRPATQRIGTDVFCHHQPNLRKCSNFHTVLTAARPSKDELRMLHSSSIHDAYRAWTITGSEWQGCPFQFAMRSPLGSPHVA
jgi:hypothetical protein